VEAETLMGRMDIALQPYLGVSKEACNITDGVSHASICLDLLKRKSA
jgi:hypothetical protein